MNASSVGTTGFAARRSFLDGSIRGVALTAACLMLLAGAPAAAGASSKGVYDVFGKQGNNVLAPGGAFQSASQEVMGTVAVNSTGAGGANPGDVYIADRAYNRIQRFDKDGNWISAWGLDVDSSVAGTGFEVCVVAGNCKPGLAQGAGGGMSSPAAVAVDQQNGDVYVTDPGNVRVDEFTATGAFLRAWGGNVVKSGSEQADEAQRLTVDAGSGQYRLTFYATSGTGNLTSGSAEVKNVVTSAGAFAAGQPIGGAGIPSGATILAVGAGTLTLSAAATATTFGTPLTAGPVSTTADIEANEPAAGVEAKLNALASINAGGGAVAVTGGPGAPGGAAPYRISFSGALADANQSELVVSSGSTPLSGGAASATIATFKDGATGFEICETPANCQTGVNGATGGAFNSVNGLEGIAVAPAGAPNAGKVLVADGSGNSNRVQEFAPDGSFLRAFGWDVVGSGPGNVTTGANETRSLRVAATAGTYSLFVGSALGGSTAAIPFDAPASTVEEKLDAVLSSVGGSVTVAGGPGDAAGSSPYTIVFGGSLAHQPVQTVEATPASVATVTTTTSGGAFEVCNAASLDVCKAGPRSNTRSLDPGRFLSGPVAVAEDSSGNIYTSESGPNSRVQRFTLSGNLITPGGSVDPAELTGSGSGGNGPLAIAVDTGAAPASTAMVYVLKQFAAGTGTPPAAQAEARVLVVDPTAAGGVGKVVETLAAQGQIGTASGRVAKGLALDTASGRLFATSALNAAPSISNERAFAYIIDAVPPIGLSDVEAAEVGSSTATLTATIDPAALPHINTVYRFEYAKAGTAGSCGEHAPGWTRAPALEVSIGNGGPVEVQTPISNLDFEATYEFCLIARTQFNGAQATASGVFTTHPTAPEAETGGAIWSSPPASGPSLLLGGTVNPGHARTTYRFEYVPQGTYEADLAAGGGGFEHATAVPVPAAEAGQAAQAVPVHQSVAGLDPGESYAYRLAATNQVGTDQGAVRSVEPPSASERFYELVSAGSSGGSGIGRGIEDVAADGTRAIFSAQIFGDPASLPGPTNKFLASRGPGGWTVGFMGPEATSAKESGVGGTGPRIAGDLGTELWPESSFSGLERAEVTFGLSRSDGTHGVAFGPLAPLTHTGHFGEYVIRGATPDLSDFVFSPVWLSGGSGTYLPGETVAHAASNLYEVAGAGTGSATIRIVNRGAAPSAGNPLGVIGGGCGAGLGGAVAAAAGIQKGAISDDGSSIYFSARPEAAQEAICSSAAPKRLYQRIDGQTTVEVSASRCTPTPACPGSPAGDDSFQGASTGGQVAYFTTNRRLLNSDTDNTSDLYVYKAGGQQLVQASAGETIGSHVAGSGAKVLGVLDTAADGSRAYFVAEGVLSGENAEHKAPLAGRKNLYVYDSSSGQLAFVGELDGTSRSDSNSNDKSDSRMWGPTGAGGAKEAFAVPVEGPAADGHFLLFTSFAPLTSDDGDEARDLYRYDAATKEMTCLSCLGDGPFDVLLSKRKVTSAEPDRKRYAPPASADVSTVVFATAEALLPEDENEGVNVDCDANDTNIRGCDVYAWQDGQLSLITGGTEGFGVGSAARLSGVSADGRNVFFTTDAQLVAADTNNATDLYDARIGGGFPAAGAQAVCVGSDECQGPPQAGPAASQAGSATFAGSGNPGAPKPCRKGFVRRGAKCVKKHHHRKHHRAKRKTGGR